MLVFHVYIYFFKDCSRSSPAVPKGAPRAGLAGAGLESGFKVPTRNTIIVI